MTFIDFKKAFDSIHRGKMMRILKAYGIPPNLLQAINNNNNNNNNFIYIALKSNNCPKRYLITK